MLGGFEREVVMISPIVLLGPQKACKYSFAVTISLLFLLLISLSSSANGAVAVYSAAIDDIIEVEAKMSPTNSED
jgi:hypothetical protein